MVAGWAQRAGQGPRGPVTPLPLRPGSLGWERMWEGAGGSILQKRLVQDGDVFWLMKGWCPTEE